MSLSLPPPKVLILAVHLAANAAVDKLAFLVQQHPTVLRKDVVLRILLTYLPETLPSAKYVHLIEALSSEDFADCEPVDIDSSVVAGLSVEEAFRKLRKLRFLPFSDAKARAEAENDYVASFLFRRAYSVDQHAGMLTQLPILFAPFAPQNDGIRTWMVSTLLPLMRRNFEYYPHHPTPYTLAEFQALPDVTAVSALLSQTGRDEDHNLLGRDLRGLVGPWLRNDARWTSVLDGADDALRDTAFATGKRICPGWERVMEWLLINASQDWRLTCAAVMQWNGSQDVDLGDFDVAWLQEEHHTYLDRRYARAIMASAYLVPEATLDAVEAVHQMVVKVTELLGEGELPSLISAAESLTPVLSWNHDHMTRNYTMHVRNDLLSESNPLTRPSPSTTSLLHALTLSAYLLTRAGLPVSAKRAGDLVFSQDEREQKAEATKLIGVIMSRNHGADDSSWIRTRRELLWLCNWGISSGADVSAMGVFGRVDVEYLESEFLNALLLNSRYSLAKDLYEADSSPLSLNVVRDIVLGAALSAFDNATNPNRTRGGLKKCEEIISAFPKTFHASLRVRQQVEHLLKATHSLSQYRLVLKQGEPFTPILLRVHPDPISVIGKVLEQNSKTYTRIQDLLQTAYSMVRAGLPDNGCSDSGSDGASSLSLDEREEQRLVSAEIRVTAMCIEAALREEDFETAYSYTVNRATADASSRLGSEAMLHNHSAWRAALQAGQYTRSSRTIAPTHLGTGSGNPHIRHLEQRLECFSTSVRLAPASQLHEILGGFRRCEEQLDSALSEQIARGIGTDKDHTDLHRLPGSFGFTTAPAQKAMPSASAGSDASAMKGKADDTVPMSLFDLSRATARAASRNLSALSSLQQSSNAGHASVNNETVGEWGRADGKSDSQHRERMRKRDQLRDAAMGTLTTGVGWLIGAPVTGDRSDAKDNER